MIGVEGVRSKGLMRTTKVAESPITERRKKFKDRLIEVQRGSSFSLCSFSRNNQSFDVNLFARSGLILKLCFCLRI